EASAASPEAKRTGRHRCSAQYAGSVASRSVIQVPVTFEMNGMRGALRVRLDARRVSSAAAGRIIGLWKAWLVRRRRQAIPRSARRRANAVAAASGPAITE